MQINEAMKKWRKTRKISQTEVANAIGMQQNSYSRYETGENIPSADKIKAIAEKFGADANELLGIEK